MNPRRILAVGLIATAGLALTACSSSAKSNPPTPKVSPAAALTAALATIGKTSYNYTLTQHGLNGGGSVDPTAMTSSIELKGVEQGTTVDIQALRVATDLFAKFDAGAAADAQLGIDPSKWMLLDQSKLTGPNAKPFDDASPDTLDVAGLLANVTNVTQPDTTHLTGTVDLTKATGINVPSADEISKAGTAATTTPFTATLDSQGRLIELKIDADAYDKAMTFDIAFSSFGAATAVTKPADADVVPAPDALYGLLNS